MSNNTIQQVSIVLSVDSMNRKAGRGDEVTKLSSEASPIGLIRDNCVILKNGK